MSFKSEGASNGFRCDTACRGLWECIEDTHSPQFSLETAVPCS